MVFVLRVNWHKYEDSTSMIKLERKTYNLAKSMPTANMVMCECNEL